MKVYVGIPMYGGAGAQFVSALLKTRVVFDRARFEVEVDIHNGCSVLPRARNEITQRFYESGFDVLLFLDSDMVWSPVDAVKLVTTGRDMACINYRKKQEDVSWVCQTYRDGEEVKATAAGTGLMALSRNCIEKMRDAHPETRYEEGGKECYALFDFLLQGGRYWGEDYVFCRRWRDIGGEIHILNDVEVSHVGEKTYTGRFQG